MPWWLSILVASLALAGQNLFFASRDLSARTFIQVLPLAMVVLLGYWHGFRNAPSFLTVWFVGTALPSLFGVGLGVLWFKDPASPRLVAGICLTCLGVALMAGWGKD